MKRYILSLITTLLFIESTAGAQSQEIRLWPGKAPGSESWSVSESVTTSPSGDRTVSNVSDPTLTVFLPDPANATGAAIVIAPGGALRLLAFDNEGVRVADWLNSKGIAAFVLKYRTLQASPAGGPGRGGLPVGARGGAAGPRQELEIRNANANPEPENAALAEVLRMGVADAQQALKLVRRNSGCMARGPGARRHHGVLGGRWRCNWDCTRGALRCVAGLSYFPLRSLADGRQRPGKRAAIVYCCGRNPLQCNQRLSGAVCGVEGGWKAG